MILSPFAQELALDIENAKLGNGNLDHISHEIDIEAEELEISQEERSHLLSLIGNVPLPNQVAS